MIVKIREKFKTPIFVGGHALSGKMEQGFDAIEAQDLSMTDLAKMLTTV